MAPGLTMPDTPAFTADGDADVCVTPTGFRTSSSSGTPSSSFPSPCASSTLTSPCASSASASAPLSPLTSVPPSPQVTRQAWLPRIATGTTLTAPPPTATSSTTMPVISWHNSPTSSCTSTPLAATATPTGATCGRNLFNLRLPSCTGPSPTSGCTTPSPSACSTPHAAQHAGAALLALPDQLLLCIWEHLDAPSRAALYHSCTALWTNAALNSAITTCSVNTLDDLITWPRHAGPPSSLRLVNGHPDGPGPRLWSDDGSGSASGSGSSGVGGAGGQQEGDGQGSMVSTTDMSDRNFELLLEAARQNTRAMEVLSNVTHVILQGRGKGTELCKRLAWLLGPLCPRLSKLLVDWCSMGGETCAAASCWLPGLTHLTLVSVNSIELRGTWPAPLLTYSDLAGLSSLTALELVDCHLPFLELGVQDITPLAALLQLRSLHLVFSDKENDWPGSKPCYLLLGLGEVSHSCSQLQELVLDGVQHAKMMSPSWPALTDLAVGFISGWHPSLVAALELDTAAPCLKRLTLGQIKCTGQSLEAKALFANRLHRALTTLAACPAPPSHLDILAPAAFTDHVPLTHLLPSLEPMHTHLLSLALDMDVVTPGVGVTLAAAAPQLQRLQLALRRECGGALAELLEALPRLQHVQLAGHSSASPAAGSQVGRSTLDGNVLSLCYVALSVQRQVPLTVVVREASAFAALCVREMRLIKPVSTQPVTLVLGA